MTTTRATNPQQAALERIVLLQLKITVAYSRANSLLALALSDAARLPHVDTGYVPQILSEDVLVEFTQLKNELADLMEYYQKQHDNLSLSMFPARVGQETDEVLRAVERLRERTEVRAQNEKSPMVDTLSITTPPSSSYQPVMPAREAATAIRQERLDNESSAKPSGAVTNGVTYHTPIPEEPRELIPDQSTPIKTTSFIPELPFLQKRENGLATLMGPDSPLLQLFAAGPWLPEGKGFITVGSQGFQWHKGIYPTDKPDDKRASLPTGFYGGEERPQCVLLRLETAIIIWPFEMNPEHIYVYFVGLSDTDPTNTFQWFPLSGLSASYTRRLVEQINALIPERPAV